MIVEIDIVWRNISRGILASERCGNFSDHLNFLIRREVREFTRLGFEVEPRMIVAIARQPPL